MRNSFDNFNSNDQNDASSGAGGNSANDSLAQLSETVNSLDPLIAIEKSLNDQVSLDYIAWMCWSVCLSCETL